MRQNPNTPAIYPKEALLSVPIICQRSEIYTLSTAKSFTD